MKSFYHLKNSSVIVSSLLFIVCMAGCSDNNKDTSKKGAAGSSGVLGTIPSISAKGVQDVEKVNSEIKKLENELIEVMKNSDAAKLQKLQEKNQVLEEKIKTIRKNTLEKINAVLARSTEGMQLPVKQADTSANYTVQNIKVKKALWNPGSTPHLVCKMNIEAREDIKQRITAACEFLSKDGSVIHTEKAYMGMGSKPKTGETAILNCNPKIADIAQMESVAVK